MNSIIIIALLIVLALALLYCIKKLFPSASVRWFYAILAVIICCFMAYLLWRWVRIPHGSVGSPSQETENQDITVYEEIPEEKLANAIVLRDEQILINNEVITDMNVVESFIDERVENNIEIVIVDDYSVSTLHHCITDICKNKGITPTLVRYDEWKNEQ